MSKRALMNDHSPPLSKFFKLGFIPCKVEQLPQGMELQEKETKRLRHTGNLLRKNLQLKDVC